MAKFSETKFGRFLTTPETFPEGERFRTNLNTDILKIIAMISMLIDHIGYVFFPEAAAFRWIGRLAFPIFSYCLTVGLVYTRSVKKYLIRLAVFALFSQPFFVLAFHPYDWQQEWSVPNIFFTLAVSLLAMSGFRERKWLLFVVCILLIMFLNLDYNITGVVLMMIFYLCRSRPAAGALLYCLYYLPALWNGYPDDPYSLSLGGLCIDWTAFSLAAALLIFPRYPVTGKSSGGRINKYFFYVFYPAHLAVIGAVRIIMGI